MATSKQLVLSLRKVFTKHADPETAMGAAKIGKVKIVTNLNFVRLWPTTGKPLTPDKKKILPIKRTITITLGK